MAQIAIHPCHPLRFALSTIDAAAAPVPPASMGKKSKRSAGRAKAGSGTPAVASASAAAAPPAAGSTATGMSSAGIPNGGGIVVAGGGSSGKKPKCNRCLSTLRDLAKARSCPGCSQLYCWRCEKQFWYCPNGKRPNGKCVDPLGRCFDCFCGKTMAKARDGFDESLSMDRRTSVLTAMEYIANNDLLTIAALPFQMCSLWYEGQCRWDGSGTVCDGDGNTLGWSACQGSPYECPACAYDVNNSRISLFRTCSNCRLHLCTACDDYGEERIVTGSLDDANVPEELRTKFPPTICRCKECMRSICVDCCLENTIGDGEFDIRPDGLSALCPPCAEKKYWSTKPCTNLSCPNEVGVPTKRCGGCHLDRYCSIECQAAAYPSHVARCHKIQAKRAAAGKEAGGTQELRSSRE